MLNSADKVEKWHIGIEPQVFEAPDTSLPKISVITPSYNQGIYIEDTIRSVVCQNYPNLEYIVIDGGSTDETVEIIKKYEAHIDYWVSEKDSGQSDAINKGFRRATGDIVAWINSDDIHLANTLHRVAAIFQENPEVSLIHGQVLNFDENGQRPIWNPPEFDFKHFIERVPIHQPGAFWKNDLFKTVGYLDEELHFCMDFDLWLKICMNYPIQAVYEPLAGFRKHANAKTNDNPPEVYYDYRKVVSVFFASVAREYIPKLEKLGLYNNPNDKTMFMGNLEISDTQKELAFNTFVYECAIQSYEFGQVGFAHKLFSNQWGVQPASSLLSFMTKNLLGLKYFKIL